MTFTPDRAGRRSHPRTGLVLGAGGVLGAAWMTGALACLQDRLPHAVAGADLVVGTSAGSVLAAAVRCQATFEELAAWQCGDAAGITGESAVLVMRDGPLPPLPRLRFGSVPLAAAAAPGSSVGGRDRVAAARRGPARRGAIAGHRAARASPRSPQPGRDAAVLASRAHLDRRDGL